MLFVSFVLELEQACVFLFELFGGGVGDVVLELELEAGEGLGGLG